MRCVIKITVVKLVFAKTINVNCFCVFYLLFFIVNLYYSGSVDVIICPQKFDTRWMIFTHFNLIDLFALCICWLILTSLVKLRHVHIVVRVNPVFFGETTRLVHKVYEAKFRDYSCGAAMSVWVNWGQCSYSFRYCGMIMKIDCQSINIYNSRIFNLYLQ